MTNMIDCGSNVATALARLTTPARNRYYYGKLLDADHFTLEQEYGNRKRWLLNRLSLGTGVLCGLDVSVVQTPNGPQIVVGPGVAIDAVGREIIVPLPSPGINPLQATDECGQPAGTPVTGPTTVTLYICYYECEAEPAPVMVSQCGPDRACECGLVRERYRLQIRPGPLPAQPLNCGTFFSAAPDPGDPDRRLRLCGLTDNACPTPQDSCVSLAEIAIDANGNPTVNQCAGRTMVYSNAVLLDLILCLAERVDQCCGGAPPPPPPATLPVVTQIYPANATVLSLAGASRQAYDQWVKTPQIQLTFSAAMSQAQLSAPDPWLAVFSVQIPPPTANLPTMQVMRMSIALSPTSTATNATYLLSAPPGAGVPRYSYFVVLINANGHTIQDQQTPPDDLAADYAGTLLSAADMAACWALNPNQSGTLPTADVTAGLVATPATLPSGQDDKAGGTFSSWFEVSPN